MKKTSKLLLAVVLTLVLSLSMIGMIGVSAEDEELPNIKTAELVAGPNELTIAEGVDGMVYTFKAVNAGEYKFSVTGPETYMVNVQMGETTLMVNAEEEVMVTVMDYVGALVVNVDLVGDYSIELDTIVLEEGPNTVESIYEWDSPIYEVKSAKGGRYTIKSDKEGVFATFILDPITGDFDSELTYMDAEPMGSVYFYIHAKDLGVDENDMPKSTSATITVEVAPIESSEEAVELKVDKNEGVSVAPGATLYYVPNESAGRYTVTVSSDKVVVGVTSDVMDPNAVIDYTVNYVDAGKADRNVYFYLKNDGEEAVTVDVTVAFAEVSNEDKPGEPAATVEAGTSQKIDMDAESVVMICVPVAAGGNYTVVTDNKDVKVGVISDAMDPNATIDYESNTIKASKADRNVYFYLYNTGDAAAVTVSVSFAAENPPTGVSAAYGAIALALIAGCGLVISKKRG